MTVGLVTKSDLAEAIRAKLNVTPEAAADNAEFLLDIFGYDTQVIDNVLEPEDRQLFYCLQETGILTTRSEENILWNGQEWRTHYWLVRTQRVAEIAADARSQNGVHTPFEDRDTVYTGLPDGVWTRVKAK